MTEGVGQGVVGLRDFSLQIQILRFAQNGNNGQKVLVFYRGQRCTYFGHYSQNDRGRCSE